MIETLFVLTMYLNGAMIEYTPKDTLSKCLTSKRLAMREVNPQSVIFKCEKLKSVQISPLTTIKGSSNK